MELFSFKIYNASIFENLLVMAVQFSPLLSKTIEMEVEQFGFERCIKLRLLSILEFG